MSLIPDYLYSSLTVLSLLTYVGGFSACVAYRRLSPWLLLAATGFVGLLVSTTIQALSIPGNRQFLDFDPLLYLLSAILDVVANLFLISGLGLALIQIQRKVAVLLERSHGQA